MTETRPCPKCGGASVDAGGRDACRTCRGTGTLPTPCLGCGEPTEGEHCSASCEAGPRRTRSSTVSLKTIRRKMRQERLTGVVDLELERLRRELEEARPRTRAECEALPRPCPFLLCKHHLFLDLNPRTGSIKFNFPGRELDEIPESCALDVADRGGITLEEVGSVCNLTRERVRQIEARVLLKLANAIGEERHA